MSNDLGLDRSGNGNNWTVNNLAYSDQMVDSPTNNFATLNPLTGKAGSLPTLSEGNLSIATQGAQATMNMPSGKWYFEALGTSTDADYAIGITEIDEANSSAMDGTANARAGFIYQANGNVRKGGDGTIVATWATYTNGDIVSFSYDTSNRELKGYKNNSLQGTLTLATPTTEYVFTAICLGGSYIANFGQDSSFAGNKTAQGNQDGNSIGDFYYAPPTDYLALCTKNLPDVAVVPSEHFNAVTYSGTGSSNAITGVGFQPDWTWIKRRSGDPNAIGNGHHSLYDSTRGVTKEMYSDLTNAEATNTNSLTAFGTDGFTVDSEARVNANSETHVAWNWKANGSGSSNTNGSITSTVSANVDAGFSVVSYSGATNATVDSSNNSGNYWTIGHGLSKAPELIIAKNRSSGGWYVGSDSLGSTPWTSGSHLVLNSTAATANNANMLWGNAAPNSSTFKVGGWDVINRNGNTYIAYAFHSVDGYSKVGSYTGNANDDAPFIYTGFRPAWLMYKKSSGAAGWFIHDSTRDPENIANQTLSADSSAAEYTSADGGTAIDLLSNGFKPGGAGGDMNGSGETYIYIAFAEQPFKYSNAR